MKLHVKHASKVYDVAVGPEDTGIALKQKLEALTGVPPARQKVMVKGRQLQDAVALISLGLKDGQALFMLGSSAPSPVPASAGDSAAAASATGAKTETSTGSNSINDESEDSDMDEGFREPHGLVNVGNSCYANATLEALHTVPELNSALEKYTGSDQMLRAWAQLVPHFGHGSSSSKPAMTPVAFMMRFQKRFPHFAEVGEDGMPKQQDAEEFWTQLLWELRMVEGTELYDAMAAFDGKFSVTTTRPGSSEDAKEVTEEDFTKLMCHININTNFLKDGLRASLTDEAETGVNESVKSTKRIARLPKYLTVQFVRFFWRRDTLKNSKILRKVTFPLNLDVGDLCTDELQARMAPARDAYRELESAVEESKRAARRARFQRLDAVPSDLPRADSGEETPETAAKRREVAEAEAAEARNEKEHLESLKQKFRSSIDADLAADATCSPHALYELQAIVTHQGMSADSGHYQCFTRNPDKANSWWRFNDDRVSEVDDNRIAQLAGGGASDSALILLYKSAEL